MLIHPAPIFVSLLVPSSSTQTTQALTHAKSHLMQNSGVSTNHQIPPIWQQTLLYGAGSSDLCFWKVAVLPSELIEQNQEQCSPTSTNTSNFPFLCQLSCIRSGLKPPGRFCIKHQLHFDCSGLQHCLSPQFRMMHAPWAFPLTSNSRFFSFISYFYLSLPGGETKIYQFCVTGMSKHWTVTIITI